METDMSSARRSTATAALITVYRRLMAAKTRTGAYRVLRCRQQILRQELRGSSNGQCLHQQGRCGEGSGFPKLAGRRTKSQRRDGTSYQYFKYYMLVR